MRTCWSQEKTPRSQPQEEPVIRSHSQREVDENTELVLPKFGRTKSKEATEVKSSYVKEEKKLVEEVEMSTGQENGESIAREASAEVQLPHNYEAILKEADSPIDRSSVDKLYHQLYRGFFLNQKRQKYWVEERSNGNCFMLLARDLLIVWGDDKRYWKWSRISHTSEGSVYVAELLNVCWLEVHARFDTSKLSPSTRYEVAFVVLIKDTVYGWEENPVILRVELPSGTKQEHKEDLQTKPRWQWMEVNVGEFTTSRENVGVMDISMHGSEGTGWKSGLVIKGVIIRPKI